jgi:protein involved in sex pheromone biosynthesis
MNKNIAILIMAAVFFLGGCATIVGDKTQLLPIASTPNDASIIITDEKGSEIFKGKTPATVTLHKSEDIQGWVC